MTALPDGVTYKTEGTLQFVSQRGYWTMVDGERHYTSCMFAALCSVLELMGLDLPLPRLKEQTPPENFVYSLHLASGASFLRGTTIADTKKAMFELLPDVPLKFANGTADETYKLIKNGAAVRVSVRCPDLPRHLRRYVGYGYEGKHAVAMVAAREDNGYKEVLWFDPMARPVATQQGEWVRYTDVIPAFVDKTGNVTSTFGYKNEALPVQPEPPVEPPINEGGGGDTEMIFSNVVERSRGVVEASSPVLHPETLATVLTVSAGTTVKLVGITPDGKYRGILVNSAKIAGTNPKIALIAAEAVGNLTVDDPCAGLQAELDQAKADLSAAQAKSVDDVADAQSIVDRHNA